MTKQNKHIKVSGIQRRNNYIPRYSFFLSQSSLFKKIQSLFFLVGQELTSRIFHKSKVVSKDTAVKKSFHYINMSGYGEDVFLKTDKKTLFLAANERLKNSHLNTKKCFKGCSPTSMSKHLVALCTFSSLKSAPETTFTRNRWGFPKGLLKSLKYSVNHSLHAFSLNSKHPVIVW